MAITPAKPAANAPAAAPDNGFVREVDEAYRRDRLLLLWRRHGRAGVVLLVAGLAALAAWLFWQDRQHRAAGDAGQALIEAMNRLEVGDGARARPVLDRMTRDGPGPYAGLARMVLANDALAGGDRAKARGLFEAVAGDAGQPGVLRDAALVKAVRLGFDQMAPADVVARLKPLAVPGNPWFGVAGELVAVAHVKAGKTDMAKPILIAIVRDTNIAASLRGRAAQLAVALGVPVDTVQAAAGGGAATP